MNAITVSRFDYCYRLFDGLPSYQLDMLQSVFNVAARLICGVSCHAYITPIRCDKLHWLRCPQRTEFKLSITVFKAWHGISNRALPRGSEFEHRSTLRSNIRNDLIMPQTSTKRGERAFCVARPSAWNRFPINVKQSNSSATLKLKNKLKTFLFSSCYV